MVPVKKKKYLFALLHASNDLAHFLQGDGAVFFSFFFVDQKKIAPLQL
jgi:hypothetical protein